MPHILLRTALVLLLLPSVATAQKRRPASTAAVQAAQSTRFKGPVIRFEGGNLHDFGTVPEGPVAAYRFIFENVGTEPVVFQNVSSSSGCMTGEWSKEPVLPGKKGYVGAYYNTQGRVGPFEKSLYISSNATDARTVEGTAPAYDRIELKVRGTVTAAPTGSVPESNSMLRTH